MTGSLAAAAAAAVFFVASHLFLSGEPLRSALIGRLGEWGFRATYSLIAVVAFVWLIAAHANAPYVELWTAGAGIRHLPLAVMPVVAVLLVCGLTTRGATAMGGEALAETSHAAPGIFKVTRHPVLWAIALWALVHIPVNGDAASLILFASIAILALAGMHHIDRRRERTLGAAWGPIALTTSVLPFAAIVSRRARFDAAGIGPWRVLGGVALYLAFLLAHGPVIGVAVLPG